MKVAIVFERSGAIRLVADEPVQAYVVDEQVPEDRVYELDDALEVGENAVDDLIGDDHVWLGGPTAIM